jgi:hypothetical protein
MSVITIIALMIVIPVLLIPAALVWYINAGSILAALRKAGVKRAARKTTGTVDV